MKKLLLPFCIIVVIAVLFSVGGRKQGGDSAVPQFSDVSEAAFSMRSSGSEDATSFLVGSFTGEHGQKMSFSGDGEAKKIAQNLSSESGTYSLLQSTDGAAILRMDIAGASNLYSFRIASPEGGFVLTDSRGAEETFIPVP